MLLCFQVDDEKDDDEEDEVKVEKDDQKTKKKNPFGLNFFARLMKFI